jgi:hypothetical protein
VPNRPGATPQLQARSARWRLRAHQALWLALAAGLAFSALPFLDLPPALHGVVGGLALVLSIRGALLARRERSRLQAAVGPPPQGPAGSPPPPQVYTTWRSDPRTVLADSFARTAVWWSCSAAALALYLVIYVSAKAR